MFTNRLEDRAARAQHVDRVLGWEVLIKHVIKRKELKDEAHQRRGTATKLTYRLKCRGRLPICISR
jgi:hypothetical protein